MTRQWVAPNNRSSHTRHFLFLDQQILGVPIIHGGHRHDPFSFRRCRTPFLLFVVPIFD
jgi:hypothetical protein